MGMASHVLTPTQVESITQVVRRDREHARRALFVGIAVVLLAGMALLVGQRLSLPTPTDRVVDHEALVPAGSFYSRTIELSTPSWHRLEVEAVEGSVHLVFKRILSPTGISAQEISWLTQAGLPVRSGKTQSLMGRLEPGTWMILLFNNDRQRPARAQVRLAIER